MPPPENIRKDGPFAQRGRAYSFDCQLRILLLIDAQVRSGVSVKQAVECLIMECEGGVPFDKRLTKRELEAAIGTGIRNYHRWRLNVLSESDESSFTRKNFAAVGMNVKKVTFRSRDGAGLAAGNALFTKTRPRGRPRKQKTS